MKFKSFLTAHKGLVKDIVTSTCLVGGTAGIVFGISAGTFKIEYMKLSDANNRLHAWQTNNYYSQKIESGWNMTPRPEGDTSDHYIDMPQQIMTTPADWRKWHKDAKSAPFEKKASMSMNTPEGTKLTDSKYNDARKKFTSIIIDGAMHTVMDRSFNQSLLEGLADFIDNTKLSNYKVDMVNSYKPSQDNTTDFINTYTSVMNEHDVLALAGFNHATPLTAMMTHKKLPDGADDPYATCANADDTATAESTAFVLLDANIADNQNIASVQFRADQPGFLAGLATCSYLFNNLDLYHDHYQDISVAAYGGVPIPTVTVYMGGFQRGIELFNYQVIYNTVGYADEHFDSTGAGIGAAEFFGVDTGFPNGEKCASTFERIYKKSKYEDEIQAIVDSGKAPEDKFADYISQGLSTKMYNEFSIKMIKLGDIQNHFSGTFAPGDAVGITKQYLNRGAAAIIAVAGPQSLDSAQEIQNQKSKSIVVGVDTAMENSDYQRYHAGCDKNTPTGEKASDAYWDQFKDEQGNYSSQAHAIIKFSAIKDLKEVTNKITRLLANGYNWDESSEPNGQMPDPARAICGVGFQTCANILNGLVSISWDGFVPVMDALQHFCFWKNVTDTINFETAWQNAVTNYITEIGGPEKWEELVPEEEYRNNITDFKKICIYNRYKSDNSQEENVYYKHYFHTIGILGQLMSQIKLRFQKELSLVPDESGGFRIMDDGEYQWLSILDWLEYNMYLSC